jgi:hypothetical protein
MRKVTWGTPRRSEHYLFPRPKLAFVGPALLLGAGLLVLLSVAWALGLRRPVSPGAVITSHGTVETSCQACHSTGHVANVRCQRCHDPATAGRLDNRSHVLFGSGDLKKAGLAPPLECATCHVEHRGRTAPLTHVDQRQCSSCHFRSFKGHPEFAVLRTPSRELPGLKFGHGPATASFKGHVAEVMEKKGLSQTQACLTCHETGTGRDFQPVSFERHCAECHEKALVATVGIPEADVLKPEVFIGGGFGTQPVTSAEFETARSRVSKNVLRHEDDWVLASARRLRRELEPEAHAAERAALQARLSRLRRRVALSTPLAQLDLEELAAREKMLETELSGLERRLQSLAPASAGSKEGRLHEIAAALAATGDDAVKVEAAKLKAAAAAPSATGTRQEFDARRKQVLALLDAVEAADPALKPRADDLRRRLVALVPGDSTEDVLTRARDQRQAELARIRDERMLRATGVMPPASALLLGEQRGLQTAITEVEVQLKRLEEGPPVAAGFGEEDRARKKESLESLVSSCVKCHAMTGATLDHVRAARPVMVRARFMHQPHLQVTADCNRCHAGIEASKLASDLNFKGVQSCQECHSAGSARQDCLSCHRYHPPAVP